MIPRATWSASRSCAEPSPPQNHGLWTSWFTGEVVRGGGWRTEKHGFDSLPLYVRDGAVIPVGARDDVPDHDYLDKLTLRDFPSSNEGEQTVTVTDHGSGDKIRFRVERSGERVEASSDGPRPWALDVVEALGAP